LATPIEQDQQKILKYMHDVEAERGVSVSIKPQRRNWINFLSD